MNSRNIFWLWFIYGSFSSFILVKLLNDIMNVYIATFLMLSFQITCYYLGLKWEEIYKNNKTSIVIIKEIKIKQHKKLDNTLIMLIILSLPLTWFLILILLTGTIDEPYPEEGQTIFHKERCT